MVVDPLLSELVYPVTWPDLLLFSEVPARIVWFQILDLKFNLATAQNSF